MTDPRRGGAPLLALALIAAAVVLPSCEIRGGSGLRVVGPSTLLSENAQRDYVKDRHAYLMKLGGRSDAQAETLLLGEMATLAAWWDRYLGECRRRVADPRMPQPPWEERNETLSWLVNGCAVIEALAGRRSPEAVGPLLRMLENGKGDGDIVIVNCSIRALGIIGDPAALPDLRRYLDEAVRGTDPDYEIVANPFNREVLEESVRALTQRSGQTAPAR